MLTSGLEHAGCFKEGTFVPLRSSGKQSSASGALCRPPSQASAWVVTTPYPWGSRAWRTRGSSWRTHSRLGPTLLPTPAGGVNGSSQSCASVLLQANWISLGLDNGHVVLKFNDKMWRSNKKYNDDQWHYLSVTRTAGRCGHMMFEELVSLQAAGS